jgi:hypothetical protein
LSVRTISTNTSLDRVKEELLYTQSGLLSQKQANTFADTVKTIVSKLYGVRNDQDLLWDKEIEAQAGLDACNFILDEIAMDLSEAKLRSIRETNPGWRDREARESKEYSLYFPKPLSSLVRLAAESQAQQMKPWITLLEKETSPELQELLSRLKQAIDATDAAVKARNDASSETAVHRVRSIEPFINEVNESRTRLYANLLTVSQDNRLSKSWADIFFRPTPPSTPTGDDRSGMERALLALIKAKQWQLTNEQLKKVVGIKDSKILEQLITRTVSVNSVDELLTGIE